MNALLDTHAFLWWITDDVRLSETARGLIGDGSNDLFISSASCWEIAIKKGLGRIELPKNFENFISEQIRINSFTNMPINLAHALNTANLPDHHRNPFDRMLIAQAMVEKMPIVTNDRYIKKYDIQIIW